MVKKSESKNYGKYGRFVDEADLLPLIRAALMKGMPKTGGNLLLRGEKGTGKTLAVHKMTDVDDPEMKAFWAELTNPVTGKPFEVPELFKFSCHEEQTYVDIVAQDILASGETRTRQQIMLQWLKPCENDRPRILLADEANFLSPSVAGFMHSLCDWQQGIWVPELGEFVKRSSQHWLVLCMNPFEKSIYTGTKEMNSALADRFMHLDVPYMSKNSEQDFLQERFPNVDYGVIRKLVEFAEKTRTAYRLDQLHIPITPRNIIDLIEVCNITGLEDFEKTAQKFIEGLYLIDQQKSVRGLWEGKTLDQIFGKTSSRD